MKKAGIIAIIVAGCLALGVGGYFTYTKVIVPKNNYNKAVSLMKKGEYKKAADYFTKLGEYKDCKDKISECRVLASGGKEMYEKIQAAKQGNKLVFGKFEQDADLTNGEEPLEWTILAKEGNKVFITTNFAIDSNSYTTEDAEGYTWDKSTIRKWLNDDFLKNAFTEEEQKSIIKTHLLPEIANEETTTVKANPTDDKVFLMSIEEANRYMPATEEEEAKKNRVNSRKLYPTQYAISRGIYTVSTGCCWWWLRDVSINGNTGINVRTNGIINAGDNSFTSNVGGIRPCMWLGADF